MPFRSRNRSAGGAVMAAAVLTVATVLLIAACGGGSKQASTSTATKSTTDASMSPAASREAFCSTSRRYWNERVAIARGENKMPNMSAMPGQQLGTASPQTTLQNARAIEAALPRLEATAPANLRAAVRTFVAGEKPYSDALVKANGDQSKLPPTAMAKSMSTLNSPQGKTVTGYWTQTCGIQLGRAASHQ